MNQKDTQIDDKLLGELSKFFSIEGEALSVIETRIAQKRSLIGYFKEAIAFAEASINAAERELRMLELTRNRKRQQVKGNT